MNFSIFISNDAISTSRERALADEAIIIIYLVTDIII